MNNIESVVKYLDEHGFYFDANGYQAVQEAVKQGIIKPAKDYFDSPEDKRKLTCWYVRATVKSKNEFPVSLNLDYILGRKRSIEPNKIYMVQLEVPETHQEVSVLVKTSKKLSPHTECQVIGICSGQNLNLSDEKLISLD